jgi:hypothetical protein
MCVQRPLPQIHMSALLSVEERAPGDLLNELSALAKAKEIGMDQGKEPSLAWRIIRQPDDWEALVDDVMMRLERVSHVLKSTMQPAGCSMCDTCHAAG